MTVAHSIAYSAIVLSLLSFTICICSLRGLASRINAINAEIVEEVMEFRGMENYIRGEYRYRMASTSFANVRVARQTPQCQCNPNNHCPPGPPGPPGLRGQDGTPVTEIVAQKSFVITRHFAGFPGPPGA
uniref:Col_cuticle_N domain-containing protein n=1 Tax=Elaeophora elaphi TaxID=1147741 RepID=A0A0R3RTA6_9BILA